MSNDKPRYKIGDELKCTIVIVDAEYDENDEDEEEEYFNIMIKELKQPIEESFSQEELDLAFNPAIIKRDIQSKIAKLNKQLEELENVT